MQEQRRSGAPREGGASPGIWGDVFDGSAATVSHGPYEERLPVAGMTVGQVRERFRDRFDIDPQAQAFVDGNEVGDDTVVQTGQQVLFARRAGEKGT